MMRAYFTTKYQRTLTSFLREEAPVSEAAIQALWFEQLYQNPLQTDAGQTISVLQPGMWNHAAGPDFLHAAFRDEAGTVHTGPVEIHLRATDWQTHGHHENPAYNPVLLHVVWEKPTRPFFPASAAFRRIPQVILQTQLLAPFSALRPFLEPAPAAGRPNARPGRCQPVLAGESLSKVLEILRTAGEHRLTRKAERWRWRVRTAGYRQALWEALAEGLGYQHNKIPFRLLAQRLPVDRLSALSAAERVALIFGVAGFLPDRNVADFPLSVRQQIRPTWEYWWKHRAALDYACLPKQIWKLSGLRPLNRPERRLAALASLVPLIPQFEKRLGAGNAVSWAKILESVRHSFWESRCTWTSRPLGKPHHLLGAERIHDLIINIFCPFLALQNPAQALTIWATRVSASNRPALIARQRLLGGLRLGKDGRETLIQQGLQQLYQDFCLADGSGCAQCSFPELLKAW